MNDKQPELVHWKDEVDGHDYGAAHDYLRIRLGEERASIVAEALRDAALTSARVNDILRACNRDALPMDDPGVHRNLVKQLSGREMSPVLLVSVDGVSDIADGYHRVSLAYRVDPFSTVPCKMVCA